MGRELLSALLVCLAVNTVLPATVKLTEKDADFWRTIANEELKAAVKLEPVVGVAKNVILFLGDGMGLPTVTAGRILAGQLKGETGETHALAFDTFPNVALSKTYDVDRQTPDSAATGTAYLCGVKTNQGTLGVNGHVTKGDCSTVTDATYVHSIVQWSLSKGKSVGVVTTTRVTHATPGATYAHTPHRDWEGSVPAGQGPCKDIAQQLVRDNPDINVIMGGGRQNFFPFNSSDPEAEGGFMTEGRQDQLNLVEEWKEHQQGKSRRHRYVWNSAEFNNVDPADTDYLLGLFNPSHMTDEVDRAKDTAGEPSLAQMADKAIRILSKNSKGFFLLVEGGKIDLNHHMNLGGRALHETVSFSKAVKKAVELTSEKDTLIVTTADHSHTFSLAGYAPRGNNILGLVPPEKEWNATRDFLPYTSLLYADGPGENGLHNGMKGRQDLTNVNTADLNYRQQAVVPMDYETHGGEDVAIYARGPMAHLFHNVHEQNYIAHVMAYASCVGAYSNDADCARSLVKPTSGSVDVRPTTRMQLCVLVLALLVMLRMM